MDVIARRRRTRSIGAVYKRALLVFEDENGRPADGPIQLENGRYVSSLEMVRLAEEAKVPQKFRTAPRLSTWYTQVYPAYWVIDHEPRQEEAALMAVSVPVSQNGAHDDDGDDDGAAVVSSNGHTAHDMMAAIASLLGHVRSERRNDPLADLIMAYERHRQSGSELHEAQHAVLAALSNRE